MFGLTSLPGFTHRKGGGPKEELKRASLVSHTHRSEGPLGPTLELWQRQIQVTVAHTTIAEEREMEAEQVKSEQEHNNICQARTLLSSDAATEIPAMTTSLPTRSKCEAW